MLKKIIVTVYLFIAIFSAVPVSAYSFVENSGLSETANGVGYSDEQKASLATQVGRVIQIFLSVLGIIFLILLIYGGFIWMTARENEQKAEEAKKIMTNAIIGLVIILGAYAITFAMMYYVDASTKEIDINNY